MFHKKINKKVNKLNIRNSQNLLFGDASKILESEVFVSGWAISLSVLFSEPPNSGGQYEYLFLFWPQNVLPLLSLVSMNIEEKICERTDKGIEMRIKA